MKQSNQKSILAGVVGNPVGHSLSPLIHTIWMKRNGINGVYVRNAVDPSYDAFSLAINSMKAVGYAGVNVTLPHKENALCYADFVSDRAKAAGAANMLTFSEDGVYADNSDIIGFADSVRAQSTDPSGTALVLGAGGAARAIIIALKMLGYSEVFIANRSPDRAEMLAEKFQCEPTEWPIDEGALGNADIIVNTTSLGMTGQPTLDIDLAKAKPSAIIADIVYSPLETDLLLQAASRGHQTIDGLAMLMGQAVPGFQQWFKGEAIVDSDLRSALVAELERRKTI